ncbi:MAG TPA: DUF58 domain-containing protein [Chthoniobacterales bacterium]|jgi:uncharacterized protein (DUF58 family)|nr:DUF58 domain-containing protein [Chthoniobacterales bacterium]
MQSVPEILKKIRKLELRARRFVETAFAGQYHSVFKGRGMNFHEFRQYDFGDEVRSIDWNVTARMGEPFVRKYIEERELTVMLLIDVSASGSYGSVNASKRELAAEVACLLAFCAIRNNDKVGLILFTDRVELYIAPRKGRTHILRLIREILYYEPEGRKTDLAQPLNFLNRVTTRRAVVFLLSDFQAVNYEKPLTICSRRHDLIAIPIEDRGEHSLPDIGVVRVEDPESSSIYEIDFSDRRVRSEFSKLAEQERIERESLFRRKSIDSVSLRTDQDYFPLLRSFFIRRAKRLRRQ